MWNETCVTACRAFGELVAVYEGPDGTLALLLAHSLVPFGDEREHWLADVRRAADEITDGLVRAGVTTDIVVLQLRPPREVARILATWTCHYDGAPARRAALADMAVAWLRESGAENGRHAARLGGLHVVRDAGLASGVLSPSLLAWYRDMMPSWLGVAPTTRRVLVLRTHRWLLERALLASTAPDLVRQDLLPAGPLSLALRRTIPAGELGLWTPWLRLVRRDLARAFEWPESRRTEAWTRWLFLIPYSLPTPPLRPPAPRVRDHPRAGHLVSAGRAIAHGGGGLA